MENYACVSYRDTKQTVIQAFRLSKMIDCAFFIHTPAQAHLWAQVMKKLIARGISAVAIIRGGYDISHLLEAYKLPSVTYGISAKTSHLKIIQLPGHFFTACSLLKAYEPSMVIGTGPVEATAAAILRKTCVIFEDSEPTPGLERSLWKRFSGAIITPSCFSLDLGNKHIRIPSYKELSYLHPNHFIPDPSVLRELGVNPGEKYAILRFNAFDAVHDIGRKGFSLNDKYKLVKTLEPFTRIFISSEDPLPEDLDKYRLAVAVHRIHHVLNYAHLLVADTGTMATEAAVLGVPSVMCLSNYHEFGNFRELESDYGLMFCFNSSASAIEKAVELIQQPNLKQDWSKKKEKLLLHKIDLAGFIAGLIIKWPESFYELKAD
jgi:predicted glycosyltransferase